MSEHSGPRWGLLALSAASLALTASGLRRTGKPWELAQQEATADDGFAGGCAFGFAGSGPPDRSRKPAGLANSAKRESYATDQDSTIQHFTDGSLALPAFKNVLLVMHCRAEASICREREWVFKQYALHFGDVFYMTESNHCAKDAGDPNVCLARLMETRGAKRDGLLYTHFDALINPANFARDFDKHAMGFFEQPIQCKLDSTMAFVVNRACSRWWTWPYHVPKWRRAWKAMGRQLIDDPRSFHHANNDLFYTPRAAYALWAALARGFARFGVAHEIAGPTIRIRIARQANISNRCLGCVGGCMARLPAKVALHPSFKCGHKFDLSDPAIKLAVPQVIEHR